MRFRQIRKSNDLRSKVGLVLCLCGVAAFFATFCERYPSIPRAFSILGFSLFSIGSLYFLRLFTRPFESELVVEGDLIRWGRSDRHQQQQKLNVSQLVCLVYDKTEYQVLGDVGRFALIPIGAGILIQPAEQEALVAYLRQNHPGLIVKIT